MPGPASPWGLLRGRVGVRVRVRVRFRDRVRARFSLGPG